MPPKAKKAPTGASNDVYYEDQQLGDDIAVYEEKLKALKRVYLDRMQALAAEKERQLVLKAQLEAGEADLEEKRCEKVDVLTDCTRAYKVSERKAVQSIAAQDVALNALQDTKKKLQDQLDSGGAEFDAQIRGKKKEFESLCERTADMEIEFVVLLADVEQCAP